MSKRKFLYSSSTNAFLFEIFLSFSHFFYSKHHCNPSKNHPCHNYIPASQNYISKIKSVVINNLIVQKICLPLSLIQTFLGFDE